MGREVGGVGFPCGGVKFVSEEENQGGPSGLRAVGRTFGGSVGVKESGQAGEVLVELGFKREPGRERRGLRNSEVFE